MKFFKYCILAGLTLSGCAQDMHGSPPSQSPSSLSNYQVLMESKDGGIYADLSDISFYQNNEFLPSFKAISTYIPALETKHHGVYIQSSSAIYVINCLTHDRATLKRLYYSSSDASGVPVLEGEQIGQWTPFSDTSVFGMISKTICKNNSQ